MSQKFNMSEGQEATSQNSAERQRQHVKRKQETHRRLQCWISNRHAERLQELGMHLEDSQASLIEQAIDLFYQHELSSQPQVEKEMVDAIK